MCGFDGSNILRRAFARYPMLKSGQFHISRIMDKHSCQDSFLPYWVIIYLLGVGCYLLLDIGSPESQRGNGNSSHALFISINTNHLLQGLSRNNNFGKIWLKMTNNGVLQHLAC